MTEKRDTPSSSHRQTPPPLVRLPPPRYHFHRSRWVKALVAVGLAVAVLIGIRSGKLRFPTYNAVPELALYKDSAVIVPDTTSPLQAEAHAAIISALEDPHTTDAQRRDALAHAIALCKNPEAGCDLKDVTVMGRELVTLRRNTRPRQPTTQASWRR